MLHWPATPGLSEVEQFRSARAARAEIAAESGPLPGAGTYGTFTVPGIPGARGFSFLQGGSGGINIAFAKGPYFYLVGQETPGQESVKAATAGLVAAAQHLYHRVSTD